MQMHGMTTNAANAADANATATATASLSQLTAWVLHKVKVPKGE